MQPAPASLAIMVPSGRRHLSSNAAVTCNNVTLEHVKDFKHLGFSISQLLTETAGIQRIINCFNKSVDCFLRKFSGVHMTVRKCIFEPFCKSIYSLENIIHRRGCKRDLDRLGTTTSHYGIKRLKALPKFHSNHHGFSLRGRSTFAHLTNWRIFKFFVGLCRTEGPCFTKLMTCMSRFSNLYAVVKTLMCETYSSLDIFDDDLDVVLSRIFFIQPREPLRKYGVPPLM